MALGRRWKTWDDEVQISLTCTNIREALEILRYILIFAIFAAIWPIGTFLDLYNPTGTL